MEEKRLVQLNELEECSNEAYENARIYKEKIKQSHDRKLIMKVFTHGQEIFLFNSKLKLFSGKLKSRWLGPFIVIKVFPYKAIEIHDKRILDIFKVNGHRLKPYLGTYIYHFRNIIEIDNPKKK
ncbi:hypothetical protein MA16_Dca024804 [Dendrobium catenatum]|uniref:Reverse transcriptase domain-containing protein n=1 Tax=Dendrobium catenatum TaxID=906689 RepID=A0A2I0VQE0_9ASPA|nr:hypothetical protein MA16_Dca024804 [Dendrobium catenatum]